MQHLGGGDMRRTLNILQSSWLSKPGEAGGGALSAKAIHARVCTNRRHLNMTLESKPLTTTPRHGLSV